MYDLHKSNYCFFLVFHWIGQLGQFSHRVAMSACLSVCLFMTIQNNLFWRSLRPLVKGLILACNDLFFLFRWFFLFSIFLGFWSQPTLHCESAHPTHSSLRKESPAELMLLTLVWDKTASGTARSKTGNGLHSWSAPRFGMGRDCLWDSEEQNR